MARRQHLLLLALVLICSCVALPRAPQTAEDDKCMHKHRANTIRSNARAEETDAEFWNDMAQSTLADKLAINYRLGIAKNVILFLGDGMSIPTQTATRIAKGGEQSSLTWENFPALGHTKTYCVDEMVADSACSATAYLGGVKGNSGTSGVTASVVLQDCVAQQNTTNHVLSIIHKAQLAGKATGLVTTTRVTHASPSAVYAHIAERDWESDYDMGFDGQDPDVCDDIAEQLVRGETGRNLNVILGGGRSKFRPDTVNDEEGKPGVRRDGADLIAEWMAMKQAEGASYGWSWDRASLEAIDIDNTDYLFGMFETSHLQYHFDNNELLKPNLHELTTIAIRSLSRNPNGFVLFVEGGRIDTAHHENRPHRSIDETKEFEKALEAALALVNPDETLVVVTADHAHSMSLGGYPLRGADIFGLNEVTGSDGLPISILTYATGPGYKDAEPDGTRYDISQDDMTDNQYEFPAVAPLNSANHAGDDVAVFAQGPWEHLFIGTYEQNFIHHAIAYASCLGEGLTVCSPERK